MKLTATQSIAPKQNSVIAISDAVGNPVVRRGYGTYGGEVDKGEVRGTSTPPNDPAQMVGTTSAGTSAPPALRAPPPKPFGYTGRRWDPDLGLYYYRARWYDPQLGTFLETDPIGALDYINLYSYVGLEPGNATDPSGMWSPLNSRGWEVNNITPEQEAQSRNESVQAVTIVGAAAVCAAGPCEAAVVFVATIPKRVVFTFIMRGISAYAKAKDPIPPPTSPPTAIRPDRPQVREPGTPRSSPKPPLPPPLRR
jgi:RHS repeat-associated protein